MLVEFAQETYNANYKFLAVPCGDYRFEDAYFSSDPIVSQTQFMGDL